MWVLQNGTTLQNGAGTLADVPRAPNARRRLLLPGDWVTHAQVQISAKSPRAEYCS